MGYGSDASLTRPSRATAAAHSGSPPALYSLLRLASAPRESAPVPVRTGHRSARSSVAIRGRTDPRRRADVGTSPYGEVGTEGVKEQTHLTQHFAAVEDSLDADGPAQATQAHLVIPFRPCALTFMRLACTLLGSCLHLVTGIKKSGPVGGRHRFLAIYL